MSIFKDWKEDTSGYVFSSKLKYLFSVKEWSQLRRWRKQRADRGWSDRDTWGMGEHVLDITSQMLRLLDEEDNPIDWEHYFSANFTQVNGYTRLSEVADDIDQYLAFAKTIWTNHLDIELPGGRINEEGLYVTNSTPAEEKKIRAAIKKHSTLGNSSAAKATKAMKFVADNHVRLWW